MHFRRAAPSRRSEMWLKMRMQGYGGIWLEEVSAINTRLALGSDITRYLPLSFRDGIGEPLRRFLDAEFIVSSI